MWDRREVVLCVSGSGDAGLIQAQLTTLTSLPLSIATVHPAVWELSSQTEQNSRSPPATVRSLQLTRDWIAVNHEWIALASTSPALLAIVPPADRIRTLARVRSFRMVDIRENTLGAEAYETWGLGQAMWRRSYQRGYEGERRLRLRYWLQG